MWFVLPQVAGLGRSSTAQHYALDGLDEARAYLDHPVLGPRLRECAAALAALPGTDPVAVMGPVDALKLRSSMTLFARAAPDEPVFAGCSTGSSAARRTRRRPRASERRPPGRRGRDGRAGLPCGVGAA